LSGDDDRPNSTAEGLPSRLQRPVICNFSASNPSKLPLYRGKIHDSYLVGRQTNNPAGRMMRRTFADMASFFTEEMTVDISQGINRRVQEGWFPGKASYGYSHRRKAEKCGAWAISNN
jgi:hypothetical protein